MIKKMIALFTATCLIITMFSTTAFAESNIAVNDKKAELLKEDGNTSYYLDGDKILKVVVDTPKSLMMRGGAKNADGTMTSSADVNVKFYESSPLSQEELLQVKAGTLTKTEEATNPMGNIRATLSVKYSWTSYGNPNLLRMISATSSYETLINEGVVAKTSSLYWRAEGEIYTNGNFTRKGILGKTINYTSPKFSNVTLMPSDQSIAPITAGATYTLNCSRGVTIKVFLNLV